MDLSLGSDVADWVCPGCGLLCDFTASPERKPSSLLTACPRAQAWRDAAAVVRDDAAVNAGGREMWRQTAEQIANRLSQAQGVLIELRGSDVQSTRLAMDIAAETHAAVVVQSHSSPLIAAEHQRRGQRIATLADVRARAEAIILLGSIEQTHPLIRRRLGRSAPGEHANRFHHVALEQADAFFRAIPPAVEGASYTAVVWTPDDPSWNALTLPVLARCLDWINASCEQNRVSLAIDVSAAAATVGSVALWRSGLRPPLLPVLSASDSRDAAYQEMPWQPMQPADRLRYDVCLRISNCVEVPSTRIVDGKADSFVGVECIGPGNEPQLRIPTAIIGYSDGGALTRGDHAMMLKCSRWPEHNSHRRSTIDQPESPVSTLQHVLRDLMSRLRPPKRPETRKAAAR